MFTLILFLHVLAASVWTGGHLVLCATALPAAHARLRLVPHLTAGRLGLMAGHVVAVTILSVAFVAVGVSFRTGWLAF